MGKSKKLKKNDINRNGSVEVRHSIDRIKAQERKYTAILVIFFMFLFCGIGYATLTFNKNVIVSDLKGSRESSLANREEFTSFGELVTLTSEHVLSDMAGLETKEYSVSLENNTSKNVKYQIMLEEDFYVINSCGCANTMIDSNLIRYSVDGADVQTLTDNGLIYEGELTSEENRNVSIKLWLTENAQVGVNNHFHGHFILKKIKG